MIKKTGGFSLVELLVVAGVISVLVVMAGALSSKFYSRRSVDNITRNISSTLQFAKLKAARQGVEYRAVFAKCTNLNTNNSDCRFCNTYQNYDSAQDELITISMERGDSNRDSTTWCLESSLDLKILKGVVLQFTPSTLNPYRYSFNPNGTGSSGSVVIQPTTAANTKKCGQIVLSTIGRIRIIEGNWDYTAGVCKAIRDPESTPPPL